MNSALAFRESPHRAESDRSVARKMAKAAQRPRSLHEFIVWFRREWAAEFPSRIHERGIEPDSQLGAPRMTGAFIHHLGIVIDGIGSTSSDYDSRTDTWSDGAARHTPILAALTLIKRDAPFMGRFLEALPYMDFDWERVALKLVPVTGQPADSTVRRAISAHPEVREIWAREALRRLWEICAKDAMDVARGAATG